MLSRRLLVGLDCSVCGNNQAKSVRFRGCLQFVSDDFSIKCREAPLSMMYSWSPTDVECRKRLLSQGYFAAEGERTSLERPDTSPSFCRCLSPELLLQDTLPSLRNLLLSPNERSVWISLVWFSLTNYSIGRMCVMALSLSYVRNCFDLVLFGLFLKH